MAKAYTPGPWHLEKCPCGSEYCAYWGIKPAGQFYQGTGFEKADAQLVSAAPDLYEALNDIMRVIATDELVPESVSYMRQARTALAKARGESYA